VWGWSAAPARSRWWDCAKKSKKDRDLATSVHKHILYFGLYILQFSNWMERSWPSHSGHRHNLNRNGFTVQKKGHLIHWRFYEKIIEIREPSHKNGRSQTLSRRVKFADGLRVDQKTLHQTNSHNLSHVPVVDAQWQSQLTASRTWHGNCFLLTNWMTFWLGRFKHPQKNVQNREQTLQGVHKFWRQPHWLSSGEWFHSHIVYPW
jgi:hypothetical protein